jgi:hypothetical protein
MALEKRSRVKLMEDAWRTAPNHSRPTSCVAEAAIDAEDHPGAIRRTDSETVAASAFNVAQPQVLFQFLIVPFDDPAVFGHFDQSRKLVKSRKIR